MKGLSQKTTKSPNLQLIISRVMKHNLREIVAEIGVKRSSHIDPKRIKDNLILRGGLTSDEVNKTVNELVELAKVHRWRKDTIKAIELIFSLPTNSTVNYVDYFNDSVKWADSFFNVPLVSAVVHLDEDAPHCHIILVPIVNGRLCGSALMGNPKRIMAMQADYHNVVSKHYGFTRQSPQKRYDLATRKEAIQIAFDALESNSGLQCSVLKALIEPHLHNPKPLLDSMNLPMPIVVKTLNPIEVKTNHGSDIQPLCSVEVKLSEAVFQDTS